MRRLVTTSILALILVITSGMTATASNPRVVVYVASQDLCYESVVAPNTLPPHGPFQLLTPSSICGPGTFATDFGPGDPGYVGGRWITLDGTRFSCPLIKPGSAPPS